MKEIKLIVLLLLLWACSWTAFGQTPSKELKIGDQVPELIFTNILNSQKKEIKLSDFKGKLVILDFWATWCSPCVAALPKMDSLQVEFKDKLIILPITEQSRETVQDMLKSKPELARLSLPYIYKTNLHTVFPHRAIPHEVWIGPDGRVIAITTDQEVNKENISKAISESNINVAAKIDVTDADKSKPFAAGAFGSKKLIPSQILYSSSIVEGFEGLGSISQTAPFPCANGLYLRTFNTQLQKLYRSALVDLLLPPVDTMSSTEFYKSKSYLFFMPARVSWEARDSSLLMVSGKGKPPVAYRNKLFSYELSLPTQDPKLFKKYMLEDLNRYFGLKYGLIGSIEKRRVKCWALQIVGKDSLFKSNGGKRYVELERGKKGFKVVNQKIDDVLCYWIMFNVPTFFAHPIINETNYDGKVDFDLGNIDPSDFNLVNDRLKNFGLEFKFVERDLDMIVIKDVHK